MHGKKAFREIKQLGIHKFLIIQVSNLLWITALVFFFFAATLGPITLVSTLSIMAPLVVLFLSLFVSRFFPKFFKEEIDKKLLC